MGTPSRSAIVRSAARDGLPTTIGRGAGHLRERGGEHRAAAEDRAVRARVGGHVASGQETARRRGPPGRRARARRSRRRPCARRRRRRRARARLRRRRGCPLATRYSRAASVPKAAPCVADGARAGTSGRCGAASAARRRATARPASRRPAAKPSGGDVAAVREERERPPRGADRARAPRRAPGRTCTSSPSRCTSVPSTSRTKPRTSSSRTAPLHEVVARLRRAGA